MGLFEGLKKKFAPKHTNVSSGGSRIYRYEEQEDTGWRPPQEYGKYAEEISDYMAQLFPDREEFVYHEIISDLVHIDVYIRRPNDEQKFYVVYTTGMSDLPMTLPKDLKDRDDIKYAELYMFLPEDWRLGEPGQSVSSEETDIWIVNYIKFLARFPHEYKTWLAYGHTLPNGPDYEPLCEGTKLGGVVLSQGDGPLECVVTKDGTRVNLYMVIPAYEEEIQYKLKYGMGALDDVFREKKLPVVLNLQRENLCADFKEKLD
ncbi:MAG: suppressor of fused domain protein [Lachnospiraceae bacterium]|nr:suppressor of fused domain protein [Lachnospiraceae bacterium]